MTKTKKLKILKQEKNTLILENKRIKFKDLLMKLCIHSKGGFLHDVFVYHCHIIDCPKDNPVIRRFKYKGRWVELFCGFFCEKDVNIQENVFGFDKKMPKDRLAFWKKRKWN